VHPSLLVFHIIDDNGVRSAFRERGYRIAQLEKAIARNLPDDAQAA